MLRRKVSISICRMMVSLQRRLETLVTTTRLLSETCLLNMGYTGGNASLKLLLPLGFFSVLSKVKQLLRMIMYTTTRCCAVGAQLHSAIKEELSETPRLAQALVCWMPLWSFSVMVHRRLRR